MAMEQSHILYPETTAKWNQSKSMKQLYRHAAKMLGPDYRIKSHFNPGGIAVWGETYGKIYFKGNPAVEAYDTSMGLLVRQWDGRNSGQNYYVHDIGQFVGLVMDLASKPFVRF